VRQDKVCVQDDLGTARRLRARASEVLFLPDELSDDDSSRPASAEQFIRSLYTQIIAERLFFDLPVDFELAEQYLMRPLNEIKAERAAVLQHVPETPANTFAAPEGEIDRAAFVEELKKDHIQALRAVVTKILEGGKLIDAGECSPELAEEITRYREHLTRFVEHGTASRDVATTV
jgi:hypothetical protein